jgi:hypothetical protein
MVTLPCVPALYLDRSQEKIKPDDSKVKPNPVPAAGEIYRIMQKLLEQGISIPMLASDH